MSGRRGFNRKSSGTNGGGSSKGQELGSRTGARSRLVMSLRAQGIEGRAGGIGVSNLAQRDG